MSELLLINGPNLNILGTRKPEIYGKTILAEVEKLVQKEVLSRNLKVVSFQSNLEGELINFLQNHANSVGAVVNPGALMMGGWSFRDALEDYLPPWIEVHISNIYSREVFRHNSILSPLASGIICGIGVLGYVLGARAICSLVKPSDDIKEAF